MSSRLRTTSGDDVGVGVAEWRWPDRTIAQCQSDLLLVGSSTSPLDQRDQADSFAVGPAVKAPRRSLRRCLGQAVTGGSLGWRRRRWRGVLSAAVVDPGLRPRFFSVLPTPANFRSR